MRTWRTVLAWSGVVAAICCAWTLVGCSGTPKVEFKQVPVMPGIYAKGYAWGENVGWINFDTRTALGPQLQQAQLDLCDNTLAGYAWGENIGWINLDDTTHYVALGPVCAPSDAACDGVISLFDYLEFKRVFEGPTVLVDCPVFDPDGDGDVDLRDLAKLQADFTG